MIGICRAVLTTIGLPSAEAKLLSISRTRKNFSASMGVNTSLRIDERRRERSMIAWGRRYFRGRAPEHRHFLGPRIRRVSHALGTISAARTPSKQPLCSGLRQGPPGSADSDGPAEIGPAQR